MLVSLGSASTSSIKRDYASALRPWLQTQPHSCSLHGTSCTGAASQQACRYGHSATSSFGAWQLFSGLVVGRLQASTVETRLHSLHHKPPLEAQTVGATAGCQRSRIADHRLCQTTQASRRGACSSLVWRRACRASRCR